MVNVLSDESEFEAILEMMRNADTGDGWLSYSAKTKLERMRDQADLLCDREQRKSSRSFSPKSSARQKNLITARGQRTQSHPFASLSGIYSSGVKLK